MSFFSQILAFNSSKSFDQFLDQFQKSSLLIQFKLIVSKIDISMKTESYIAAFSEKTKI